LAECKGKKVGSQEYRALRQHYSCRVCSGPSCLTQFADKTGESIENNRQSGCKHAIGHAAPLQFPIRAERIAKPQGMFVSALGIKLVFMPLFTITGTSTVSQELGTRGGGGVVLAAILGQPLQGGGIGKQDRGSKINQCFHLHKSGLLAGRKL